MTTPKELGYFFPAEWHPHEATWLSWPHKEASWPGKLDAIYPYYAQFIKALAAGENVCINVGHAAMQQLATRAASISFPIPPTMPGAATTARLS